MAEGKVTRETGINWSIVTVGVIIMSLAVAGIQNTPLRVIVAAVVILLAIYWSRSRQETEIENPLLEQLHKQTEGLDRRKYGRLRSSTEGILDHVREMNRIAIDGREGKLSQRHVQAEMDRLAASMRDLIDDVRKAAGIPTPHDLPTGPKPHIVIPKAVNESQGGGKKD